MLEFIRDEKNEKRVLAILFIITFVINLTFIVQSKMIYMSEDEFGPIAIAAYFCGQDWSSVLKNTSYYSYGYALILTPLFWITNSAISFYRLAIVLNAFLTASIVPISYFTGKKLFSNANRENLFIASFLSANFVANIGRSQSAWCETFLIFLFWCLVFSFVALEESINHTKVFVASFLTVFMYAVHQRTLGIVITSLFSFFLLCMLKKYGKRYLLHFYAESGILLIIHYFIKQFVKTNIWLNSTASQVNDYGSIFDKFTSVNVFVYIKGIIYAICGHLFYVNIVTFGLATFALIILVTKFYKILISIKTKKEIEYPMVYFLIGLSFLLTFAINVIGTTPLSFQEYVRNDYLIYGRYIENVLGILIYIAIFFILENKIKKIYLFHALWIITITTLITARGFRYISSLIFYSICSIGLSIFYFDGKMHFWIAFLVVVGFLLLINYDTNKKRKNFYFGLISLFWIFTGLFYIKQNVLPPEQHNYQLTKLINEKERLNQKSDFYFYGKDTTLNDTFFQFLLKDKQSLKFQDDYSIIPEGTFYGVTDDFSFLLQHNELCVLDGVGGLFLFTNENENKEEGIDIPLSLFGSFFNDTRDDSKVMNDGKEGFLLYGPYISLEQGEYEIEITYSQNGTSTEMLGGADICCNLTGIVYDEKSMEALGGNADVVTLKFSLVEMTHNIEIRVYVPEGVNMTVSKVKLNKVK